MGGYAAGLPQINSSGGGNVINLNDLVRSEFNDVTSVATGVLTTVISYLVTPQLTQLMNVEFGGTNIAKFTLTVNNIAKAQYYTYFGDGLTGTWDFRALDNGFLLNPGNTVRVTVVHGRPNMGDFYARLNMLFITP